MSQAEELLNSVSEEVPVHIHPVPDTDTYFIIDPITRKIENTNRKKTVVMQYDHNSERFTFELPRYVDGHDMLECTSVTVNVDNIESHTEEYTEEPRVNSDAPDMTDLRLHPNDPEKVISSWLISRNSTQLAGILSFHIEYKCVDTNGNVVYEWSTDAYDDIEVKARKKNGEAAVIEHTDLLEQWRARIFGAGDSVMANIAAEGKTQVAAVKAESETQQEAVELKGALTLDSIPEDYTETNNMADEAVRSKSDAIVCEVAGESITLNDSSDDHIRGLKLFGKSTQNGIPTPDSPVEITSVENPTINVYGKNLLPNEYASDYITHNGITYADAGDGKLSVRGTATANSSFAFASFAANKRTPIPAGTYTVSGNPSEDVYFGFYLYDSQSASDHSQAISRIVKGKSWTFTIDKDSYYGTYVHVPSGNTVDTIISPQLEVGSQATGYEPPRISRSLSIPSRRIHGIPVTEGGNYTDSDGQQWICDEVDLERGVYVQRIYIGQPSFDSASVTAPSAGYTEGRVYAKTRLITNGLSDRFIYSQGGSAKERFAVLTDGAMYFTIKGEYTETEWRDKMNSISPKVIAPLATPIEIPLTAEEITAFKALRTNHPNTTVLNDSCAWMNVKYNADTKTYIHESREKYLDTHVYDALILRDSNTNAIYRLTISNGAITLNGGD